MLVPSVLFVKLYPYFFIKKGLGLLLVKQLPDVNTYSVKAYNASILHVRGVLLRRPLG